jgi:hypothetical protein
VKYKIIPKKNRFIVKKKSCFPFIWLTCKQSFESGSGSTLTTPYSFKSPKLAIEWINKKVFIEIFVYQEKYSQIKERLPLIPSK